MNARACGHFSFGEATMEYLILIYVDEALAAYAQAATLASNAVERQYLLRRQGEMRLPLV